MKLAQTIYVGGLTFDYAHMIPGHPKCGPLHGHTSTVRVDVTGAIDEHDMVLDFAVLKRTLLDVLDGLDHRFLLCSRYVRADGPVARVFYERDNGTHDLTLPADELVVLEAEPTIESIAGLLLERACEAFEASGQRFTAVRVECTEGHSKGAVASGRAGAEA
jgi:6-pyruvoyltetrahydropterin/6-carboxytetrahydropterin synthase